MRREIQAIRDRKRDDNTEYIYKLYKSELEKNVGLLNQMIEEKKNPFYRLITITRDKLWGELADYSKDLSLMQQLSRVYCEFELINNKIEIMNAVRVYDINNVGNTDRTRK